MSESTEHWPDFHGWGGVPERLRPGLARYVSTGGRMGSFLEAVIANDLHEAISRADDDSLAAIKPIVQFLYNNTPGGCWGSKERVATWRAKGGLNGGALDAR